MIGKQASLLLAALAVWGLAILAGHTIYEGMATGCVQAKYGRHCQAAEPILYVVTIILTGIACCCSIGVGALLAAFAFRRQR